MDHFWKLPQCGIGATVLLCFLCAAPFAGASALSVNFPRDGDILTRHDGDETTDGLSITVRGSAPAGARVLVNGAAAERSGDAFSCALRLTARQTRIVAVSGEARAESEVFWNRGSQKRYRFSVDDNIQFLKDLGLNPGAYPSLFDHWYLAFWREMHEKYGAKIHINIYYQTDGFDLSQMPDTWKDEWCANASWLHLSFHALQDKPDRPYRNARYAQMAHDYDLVCGHIRRFAGTEVLGNTTTVHWAECPKDAALALRDRGIENLVGIFTAHNGSCNTGYYFPLEQCARIDSRPAWHDRETGMNFIPCAMVVNSFAVEEIAPTLDERTVSPHTAELVELLIHEQYFRKELDLYQPTVLDKVRTALQWATDKGYEPVFWSDGFLGTPSAEKN